MTAQRGIQSIEVGGRLLQADQAELKRQRAQAVAAARLVLHDQAQLAEAHQVGVGLGRGHAGAGGQFLQRQRAAVVGQGAQQGTADFDALDATLGGLVGGRVDGRLGAGHGDDSSMANGFDNTEPLR